MNGCLSLLILIASPCGVSELQSVGLNLSELDSGWSNPLAVHPLYHRVVSRLSAKSEIRGGRRWLIVEAQSKLATDVPLGLTATWKRTVPLDQIKLDVHNLAKRPASISVAVTASGGRRITTSGAELAPDEQRTILFDMLDAEPSQVPGATASVTQITLQLQGLLPGEPYDLAFGRLKFCRLPDVPAIQLSMIEHHAGAGTDVQLTWPPGSGGPRQGHQQIVVALRKNGYTFLNAVMPAVVERPNSVRFGPLNLHLPKEMPGGEYELQADLRRWKIAGRTGRRPRLGTLTVDGHRPGALAKVQVRPVQTTPVLHLNGKAASGLAYMTYRVEERNLAQFAESGVRIVSFDTCCGMHPYRLADPTWPGPGPQNFSQCDARITRILSAHPRAKILVRCYVANPRWWSDKYPEQCVVGIAAGGKRVAYEEPPGYRPGSWASPQWRHDMGHAFREFVQHLRGASYADHVIGIMPCSGTTEEWMFSGSNTGVPADYSEPATVGFRAYLQRRYGTDRELQKAWGDADVRLHTASPPVSAAVVAGNTTDFVELPRQQPIVDWWLYLSDLTADTIEHFARIVKSESGGDWLAGAFYGYVLQFSEARMVRAGHLAIDRMTRSPYLDFFSSPTLYSHRSLKRGGYSTFMSLTESYRLHNKLWWNENDIRTFRVKSVPNVHADQIDRRQTPDETISLLRRELGNVLTHGMTQWYFDMGGGWYDDPLLSAEISRQVRVADRLLTADRKSASEIAVVIDPTAFALQLPTTQVNRWLVLGQVASLGWMGAPFDLVTLADIDSMPSRKLWIFLNLFGPSSPQIARVHERLRRDEATGLFVYASGHLSPPGSMKDLTGIHIITDDTRRKVDVRVLKHGEKDPQNILYGTSSPVGPARFPGGQIAPTFHVEDPGAEPLGRDMVTGQVALAAKRLPGWTSVYSAAPGLSAEVLRILAGRAGVHLYTQRPAVVYANRALLSVTVDAEGTYRLKLPAAADVVDAISEQTVAAATRAFRARFSTRQTRLFYLRPGSK